LHLGADLAVAFIFLAPAFSSYLWISRLSLPGDRNLRVLCGIVLWQSLLLIAIQILAALQIAGLFARVTIAEIATVQAFLLAASVVWAVARPSKATGNTRCASTRTKWPRYILAATAILAFSYLTFAVDLFSSFPDGFDTLAYHLPVALHWLQSGSLAIPASRAWRSSLPGNAEIGMMVLLATGKESLIVVVNCVAMLTLAIATYLMAKRMCRGNASAAFISTLLLSIPIIEFQTFSGYVDLFGTAFLVASFALLFSAKEARESERGKLLALLFLSALACGISMGTKPIYYLYGGAEVMFAVFVLYRSPAANPKALFARGAVLIVVGTLLPSVFWFGRATAATGNPVFPMRVSVGEHVLLPGYASTEITPPEFEERFVRSRAEWLVYPWTEWDRYPGYLLIPYGEGGGVGAAFASLVVVGIAFFIYRVFDQRRSSANDWRLLLVLLAAWLTWWFVLHRVLRFGLPIVVLSCIMATPFIEASSLRSKRAFTILLLGSLVSTCAISSFVPFHSLLGRLRTGRWSRADYYEYPHLLDELPAGSCVLNYTRRMEKNFALAGAGLKNCVVPTFELPDQLTSDFLLEHNVDFVAETITGDETPTPPAPGTSLVTTQEVKSGENRIRWLIWKVEKPSNVGAK
jgi:hypothetical protein